MLPRLCAALPRAPVGASLPGCAWVRAPSLALAPPRPLLGPTALALHAEQKRYKFYDPSRAYKLRQEKAKIEDEVQSQMNEALLSRKDLESVLLIGHKGGQLGQMSVAEALDKAKEAGYDLMIVNDKLTPPVLKLVEGHKVVKEKTDNFLQQRKDRGWKEIRISDTISEHDLQIKVMKMRQMIEKKIKLQFVVKFKDRRQYSEPLARALITNVMARMKDILDKKSGIVQSKSDVYGQFLPNLAELKRREAAGIKELSPGQKMLLEAEQTMRKHEELVGKDSDETMSTGEEVDEGMEDEEDMEEEEEEEEEEKKVPAKGQQKGAPQAQKEGAAQQQKGKPQAAPKRVQEEEEEEEDDEDFEEEEEEEMPKKGMAKGKAPPPQQKGKGAPPPSTGKGKPAPAKGRAQVEEEDEEDMEDDEDEFEEEEEEEEEVKPTPKAAPVPSKGAPQPSKSAPQPPPKAAPAPVSPKNTPPPQPAKPAPQAQAKGAQAPQAAGKAPQKPQQQQKKPAKDDDEDEWSEEEEDEKPAKSVDWESMLGKKGKKGKK